MKVFILSALAIFLIIFLWSGLMFIDFHTFFHLFPANFDPLVKLDIHTPFLEIWKAIMYVLAFALLSLIIPFGTGIGTLVCISWIPEWCRETLHAHEKKVRKNIYTAHRKTWDEYHTEKALGTFSLEEVIEQFHKLPESLLTDSKVEPVKIPNNYGADYFYDAGDRLWRRAGSGVVAFTEVSLAMNGMTKLQSEVAGPDGRMIDVTAMGCSAVSAWPVAPADRIIRR